MKSSKTESMRSVRSSKSMRSVKSLRNIPNDLLEEPLPIFEECLPLVCKKYSCPFSISVKKEYQQDDFYKQLKAPETRIKYKKIIITSQYPPAPVSENVVATPVDRTTDTTSEVSTDEDTINVTVYYDNSNNLTEIYLNRVRCMPRSLIQIIGYLAPFYEYLTKITICTCRIDSFIIYELSKTINISSITDICLDGSPVAAGNYFILLDHHQSRIKYLSLCRCCINDEACIQIATRLHHLCPAEKTLLLLNLSSNRITDEGAKCLGQALRSNRRLRYLNLADNHIGDDGTGFIFDSLIEFRLTYDEMMSKRKRRLDYLKARRMCILNFFNEYDARSDDFTQFSSKPGTKKQRGLTNKNRVNSKKENLRKNNSTSVNDCLFKAEAFATQFLGPFVDPFSPLNTTPKDGYTYCFGNMVLCYLNLSYNQLSYFSIKKLLTVLQYQKIAKRVNQTGLIKVVIEGNDIPKACVEYQKICDLNRLAKSMHNFSGKTSSTGARQKGRQTRISELPTRFEF